jgi:hypothetical protein
MKGLGRLAAYLSGLDGVDLACRLTLLLYLCADTIAGRSWYFQLPLYLLAAAGLLLPGLHRCRFLWFLFTLVLALKTLANWWVQDNHHFLSLYWCLALGLALGRPEPARLLAANARLLLGLTFGCTVLWKGLLSPDFASGAYFHYTLLTDSRFEPLGLLLGDMSPEAYAHNQAQLDHLARTQAGAVQLRSTPQLDSLALFIAWWLLSLQTLLALAFLGPPRWKLARRRHALLLLFCATTYLGAANVALSFGWTLLILGLAQCPPDEGRARLAYLAGAALLFVYYFEVPARAALRLFAS